MFGNIQQCYISTNLKQFENIILKDWNLQPYNDKIYPSLFVGLYSKEDIDTFKKHNHSRYLFLYGSDIEFIIENNWINEINIKIFATNKLVTQIFVRTEENKRRLESYGVDCSILSIDIVNPYTYNYNNNINITTSRKRIFIYDGFDPKYKYHYGEKEINKIINKLTPYKFIFSSSINKNDPNYLENIVKIYASCFIGFQIIDHDIQIAQDFCRLNIPYICNGNTITNCRKWEYLQDIINIITKREMKFDFFKAVLYNEELRTKKMSNYGKYNKYICNFYNNTQLKMKDYIITLLIPKKEIQHFTPEKKEYIYKLINLFKTIGYQSELLYYDEHTQNSNVKRVFLIWGTPSCLELYQSGKVGNYDIVIQSLDFQEEEIQKYPNIAISTTINYLSKLGMNIYCFGTEENMKDINLKDKTFIINHNNHTKTWEEILEDPEIDNNNSSYVQWYNVMCNIQAREIKYIPRRMFERTKYTYSSLPNIDFSKILNPFQKNKKLIYKLTMKNKTTLIFYDDENKYIFKYENQIFTYESKIINTHKAIFYIIHENNKYNIYINNIFLDEITKITNIELSSSQNEKIVSLLYPVSTKQIMKENLINILYTFQRYENKETKHQYTIAHMDTIDENIFDEYILNSHWDYIFVENNKPHIYQFNRGYTKNLYQYICYTDWILFYDIDLVFDDSIIDDMMNYTNDYDIIKPYEEQVIYTHPKQKLDFMTNYQNNIKQFCEKLPDRKFFFPFAGGAFMIKKSVMMDLGGFDEINDYGYEDVFLDIAFLEKKIKSFRLSNKIFHLYHESRECESSEKIEEFNKKYYCCFYRKDKNYIDKQRVFNYHDHCQHETKYLDKLIEQKKKMNANLRLFFSEEYKNYANLKPQIQ
jgi:hypothetical protein